ncbi:hypothetical protein GZ212_15740 [Mangrovimonas sp. CR14]|uniref:hypothetical protein n=1 Tax=Mangrovimonas sp. CR14 TaxID=2706120 RepID=UPI0014239F65|nr:hypothetical protein [Mangrovimonas sp. CR14]NIK93613.1 hypothetical protein [Mangrovimonas sp. CR14]
MKIKKLILLMGILSGIFGCSQNKKLIELTSNQDAEEGWQDLIFTITQKVKLDNGFWSLTCKAKYENQTVGLKINIADGIPAGIVGKEIDNTSFASKGVEIQSIGKESDKLIEVISKLYGQPKSSVFTSEKLIFTAFPLNKEKAILENGRFHFKLFFDENDEQNLYAEIFLNPDLKNGTLELNEKDEEYRMNIVKLLSEK